MKDYYIKKLIELESNPIIIGQAYFDLAEEVYKFSYELFCELFPDLVPYNEDYIF